MKKIALVALAALMVLSLVGCTKNCKKIGCNEPIYDPDLGYCTEHVFKYYEALGEKIARK